LGDIKEIAMPARAKYEKDLSEIFDRLVLMCRYIESAIEKSVKAFIERDFELVQEVFAEDKIVDKLERKIEKACLRLLVMQQPVASDFREVYAALKMITDLERIGDQARDIAEITTRTESEEYTGKLENIHQMAVIVIQMVKDGIQAYINRDLELARSIETTDDKVDELFNVIRNEIVAQVKKAPDGAEQAIMLLMVTKYLERIGDHAVNLGEWVEYAATGKAPKKETKKEKTKA